MPAALLPKKSTASPFLREIACPPAPFNKLKGKKGKELLISVGERNLKKRKEDHHKEVAKESLKKLQACRGRDRTSTSAIPVQTSDFCFATA